MDLKDSWILNKFIAHRGFHNKENPENTLGAFQRAIENNFAIECDVRILKDDTLILIHDDNISRVTEKDGYVSTLSYEDIKKLKVKSSKFSIPTIDELLKLVDGKVPIMFDIKDINTKHIGKLEKILCEKLAKYKGEFAIASSNPYVLMWFKTNHPEMLRGIISSFYRNEEEGKQFVKNVIVRSILKRMVLNKKAEPNFVAYFKNNLPNRFVKRAKLPVIAWTIQSQEEYLKVLKYSDNIIFENFQPKI